MTYMTKAAATKIASHLIGNVHRVAANGNSVTWGYTYACGDRQITTSSCGSYVEAAYYRREAIKDMVELLVNGSDELGNGLAPTHPAPEWMSLEFRW